MIKTKGEIKSVFSSIRFALFFACQIEHNEIYGLWAPVAKRKEQNAMRLSRFSCRLGILSTLLALYLAGCATGRNDFVAVDRADGKLSAQGQMARALESALYPDTPLAADYWVYHKKTPSKNNPMAAPFQGVAAYLGSKDCKTMRYIGQYVERTVDNKSMAGYLTLSEGGTKLRAIWGTGDVNHALDFDEIPGVVRATCDVCDMSDTTLANWQTRTFGRAPTKIVSGCVAKVGNLDCQGKLLAAGEKELFIDQIGHLFFFIQGTVLFTDPGRRSGFFSPETEPSKITVMYRFIDNATTGETIPVTRDTSQPNRR